MLAPPTASHPTPPSAPRLRRDLRIGSAGCKRHALGDRPSMAGHGACDAALRSAPSRGEETGMADAGGSPPARTIGVDVGGTFTDVVLSDGAARTFTTMPARWTQSAQRT